MKKNIMMRIASVLMIAVLLTTCVISGTFAKYISTAEGTASATVAKWDIDLGTTDISSAETQEFTFSLFDTIKDEDGLDVDADVNGNKLAPGTSGSFSIELKNNSDVNVAYSVAFAKDATATTVTKTLPIKFSLDKNAAENAWASDISALSFNNGELNFTDNKTATIEIYWKWAFEGNVDNAVGIEAGTYAVTATITATQVN